MTFRHIAMTSKWQINLKYLRLFSLPQWTRKFLFFFFQAEDGIRYHCVTGVQTCALPISDGAHHVGAAQMGPGRPDECPVGDRKSVVQGKSVDLGGRRIIKKKKSTHTIQPLPITINIVHNHPPTYLLDYL